MSQEQAPYFAGNRAPVSAPSHIELLGRAAVALKWEGQPRAFYDTAVSDYLLKRRCQFTDLTVQDLIRLAEYAASANADALARRLQIPS
jgi:hypothetical protein